jgi:hypothetical protein
MDFVIQKPLKHKHTYSTYPHIKHPSFKPCEGIKFLLSVKNAPRTAGRMHDKQYLDQEEGGITLSSQASGFVP